MTENPNVGAGDASGASGEPTSQVSQTAAQPIGDDATKLLAGLGEKFDSLEKQLRGLQGRQDKAENNFREQLARLNQFKKEGMSDEDALAAMETVDREEQRWKSLEQKLEDLAGRFASAGTQANEQQQVAKVFESLGLDTKDPRVASALVKKYDSPDAVELAAYRLQRELAASPNPNSAQAASMSGGVNGASSSADAQFLRLEELYKNYSANRVEIEAIEKNLTAAGAITR